MIDYRALPDWDARVRELTGGRGADLVVDVGGPGSLARSIAAIRYCGHVSVVGNLAGKATIDPGALFAKRASMCGIQVGSRDMFEAMNRAIEVAKTRARDRPRVRFHRCPRGLRAPRERQALRQGGDQDPVGGRRSLAMPRVTICTYRSKGGEKS